MFTGSKKKLLDLIKRKGTVSVDEAVEQTDLAKTTLREHFLQLERDGYLQRGYERSGPGRPSLHYQLTQKGNGLYPSSESAMLREMLSYLKSRNNDQLIEDFFSSFWDKRLQKAQNRIEEASANDLETKLTVVTEMLEEEGFMPEFSIDDDRDTANIKECNCPFSEVVKETRLPCKLEAIFYQKLFSSKTERTTYIPEGDHSCTYDIPTDP